MQPDTEALLAAGLAATGITDPAIGARLGAYVDLLGRWNRRFSLTAARDERTVVTRHVLDSLAVLAFIDADPVLDLGSGAGLPGLVLAVARPQHRFVLLDSVLRKTRFLEQARIELALANVEVVRARAEQWRPPQPFPLIVSRAFASLADFLTAASHLLAPRGRLLAMKGRLPVAELDALVARGLACRTHALRVPGLAAERHLVVIEAPPAGPRSPPGGSVQ